MNLPYGILPRQRLHELRESGVVLCPEAAVGPTSIDVTLGDVFYTEHRPSLWQRLLGDARVVRPAQGLGPPMDIHQGSVVLRPGRFALGSVQEYLALPLGITAELRLRSTPARCGLQHALAVWVDPGFEGRITVELSNTWRWHKMGLRAQDKVGQLVFHSHEPTIIGYRGVYGGDMTTQQAKAH